MLAPLISLALLGPAAAQPGATNTLSWTAPQGCPGTADVRRGVEVLLGGPFEQPRFDPVQARGTVTVADDAWALELSITTPSGTRTRTLAGTSCQELADVTAVLVAIAIDPSVEIAAPGPEPEPEPQPETSPEPAPEPTPTPTPEPAPEPAAEPTRLRGAARVGAMVGGGALPGVSPGVAGQFGATWPRARVDLRGSYYFARPARRDGATGRIQLWTLQPRGCGVLRPHPVLQIPLCLGLDVGMMSGTGERVASSRTGRLPWLALVPAAELVVTAWDHVGFFLGADLAIALLRPGFEVEGTGVLHRAGPVAGQGRIGLELRFP